VLAWGSDGETATPTARILRARRAPRGLSFRKQPKPAPGFFGAISSQANLAEQETTNRQLRGEEEALRLCSLEQLRALLAALELGGTRVRSALLSGEVAAKARAEAEEAAVCGVCLHRPRDTALNCGHLTCDRCAPRLASCPICRTPISNRTRVFI